MNYVFLDLLHESTSLRFMKTWRQRYIKYSEISSRREDLTITAFICRMIFIWGGSGKEPEITPVEPDLGNASGGNIEHNPISSHPSPII
jgi:hypothetical protein